MKVKRILSLATVTSMLMGSAAFAAVPTNSVVLGDEGYAVDLLFDNTYTAQIQTAANNAGGALYYNLNDAGWKDIFTGADVTDFTGWPQITYMNALGQTVQYEAGNGDEVVEGLAYTVDTVVQQDAEGFYYIAVNFNKDLGTLGADILEDLGEGQYISVDGDLTIANADGSPEVAAAQPSVLKVYLAEAEAIADDATVSFSFIDGAIVAADDSELAAGDLDVTVTLTANPANDEI